MKVVIVSRSGAVLKRDVYAEIARRMKERGATDGEVDTFRFAADEFQDEIERYGASLKEST